MDNNQLQSNESNQVQPVQVNDAQKQANIKNNERNGRGLFYGIVAVAIFIVMAVGATFAYFTASAQSAGDTVSAKSATVNLRFISYNSGWMSDDLVPASTNIAGYAFQMQDDTTANALCRDDNNAHSVCSVFVFQIYNSDSTTLVANIDVESTENYFTNLYALMYEISLDENNFTTYNGTGVNVGDSNKHNKDGDPKFLTGDEDPEEVDDTFITVQDVRGDGNVTLNAGSDVGTTYQPIFVNRAGVTKTLLNYEDPDTGDSVPSIEIHLPKTHDGNAESGVSLNLSDSDRIVRVASGVNIYGGSTFGSTINAATDYHRLNTFALVLYIKDTNENQTLADAEKTFSGRIIVTPADGSEGGVKGEITAAEGFNFGISNNNEEPGQSGG